MRGLCQGWGAPSPPLKPSPEPFSGLLAETASCRPADLVECADYDEFQAGDLYELALEQCGDVVGHGVQTRTKVVHGWQETRPAMCSGVDSSDTSLVL